MVELLYLLFEGAMCCLRVITRCTVLRNMAASSILGHKYCEKTCAVSNLSFSIVIKHSADGSLCIFILQHTEHSTSVK